MTETQNTDDEPTADELHRTARSLDDGDRVLVNDRSRPLTVTGRHRKPCHKTYTQDDHYKIVELEGNGTEYHLLWMDGSVKPMLYKERDWELTETPTGDTQYEYPRSGDRVYNLTIVTDDE